MNEALKLAKYNAKVAREQRLHDDLKGLVSHPVVAMIAGCAAVEWLQNNVTLPSADVVQTSTVPLWSFGFNFGPFKPIDVGSRAVTTSRGSAKMLYSQTLATAIEVAILMWGTKTTVKDVADVLKTVTAMPAQLGASAASLAVLAK